MKRCFGCGAHAHILTEGLLCFECWRKTPARSKDSPEGAKAKEGEP